MSTPSPPPPPFAFPQESLLEKGAVDVVTGPDAYRDLPRLLGLVGTAGGGEGAGAVNIQVMETWKYVFILHSCLFRHKAHHNERTAPFPCLPPPVMHEVITPHSPREVSSLLCCHTLLLRSLAEAHGA